MKPKLTQEVITNISKEVKEGSFVEHACRLCDISKTSYYDWLERGERELEAIESGELENSLYADFWIAIKKAEATCIKDNITEAKKDADTRHSWEERFRFLESRFPKYFRREISIQVDDETAERRYQELLAALRQPKIEVSNVPLALSEATEVRK